jgi:hypothetical protein
MFINYIRLIKGTHDSLIEKGGIYKKLVLRQLMAGNSTVATD